METVTDKNQLSRLISKLYIADNPYYKYDSFSVENYSDKLISNAFTYVSRKNYEDVGFISFYANDMENKTAHIAFLGVLPEYQGKKIAHALMDGCIRKCVDLGMKEIKLEVNKENARAIRFYGKYNFEITKKTLKDYHMKKNLQ